MYESMVVVGLHPNCDIQALQRQYFVRKSEGSGKLRSALGYQNQSRVEPNVEPQVMIIVVIVVSTVVFILIVSGTSTNFMLKLYYYYDQYNFR